MSMIYFEFDKTKEALLALAKEFPDRRTEERYEAHPLGLGLFLRSARLLQYFDGGQPWCIVGHLIVRLGEDTKGLDEDASIGDIGNGGPYDFDSYRTWFMLDRIDRLEEDHEYTWAEIIARAVAEAEMEVEPTPENECQICIDHPGWDRPIPEGPYPVARAMEVGAKDCPACNGTTTISEAAEVTLASIGIES